MDKMIITKYGRVIYHEKIQRIFKSNVGYIYDMDDEPVDPYALFALMENGEIVNIGNFRNYDVFEIIDILLDIFEDDWKATFNVNLEEYGVREYLKLLEYVMGKQYPIAVEKLKTSLANGELDVSFT